MRWTFGGERPDGSLVKPVTLKYAELRRYASAGCPLCHGLGYLWFKKETCTCVLDGLERAHGAASVRLPVASTLHVDPTYRQELFPAWDIGWTLGPERCGACKEIRIG